MNNRPPVGFVVEGHGEYNCYPSLFCKISEAYGGIRIPILNAGGCGSLIRRLSDQLNDLLMIDSPENVIVTVDLKDALHQKLAKDYDDLIAIMSHEISEWRSGALNNPRLQPLPDRIVCVVQVRKFESWLISDIDGLKRADLVRFDAESIADAEMIDEPTVWLKNALKIEGSVKSPQFAKKIVSAISPRIMRQHSASFDKFHRECESMYADWLAKLSAACA